MVNRNVHAGPILLGMLHEETNGERALFVQSCDHRPNRAAWLAGSCVVGGMILTTGPQAVKGLGPACMVSCDHTS